MSNAKPVSLFPLNFKQAIGALIKVTPTPKKKRVVVKRKKRKPSQ